MALDNANKRRSVLGLFSPTVRPLPLPDGTVELGDRYHFALMYNTSESVIVVPTLIGVWSHPITARAFTGPITVMANTGPITAKAKTTVEL